TPNGVPREEARTPTDGPQDGTTCKRLAHPPSPLHRKGLHMRGWLSRLLFPRRRPRSCHGRLLRPACEPLEDRTVPSTILWTNRGSAAADTDGFNAVYGTRADAARAVADAAVRAWQNVIANFNYSDGTNTYQLTITTSPAEPGLGAWS